MSKNNLNKSEKSRYSRHLKIENWDQLRLKAATVLVYGLEGLGSASVQYLAAAGIGRLRICDPGVVKREDLNHQVLYTEVSVGALKAHVARARLKVLNPDIELEAFDITPDEKSLMKMTDGCDVLLNGSSDAACSRLLNHRAVEMNIPFIYGAALGWKGVVAMFHHPDTACYECFEKHSRIKSEDSEEQIGFLSGQVGTIQAAETVKFLMGVKSNLRGKVLKINSISNEFKVDAVNKDKECSVCSGK